MIDTHSHLLPGLDHGCPDLGTSLQMARQAWEIGTKTVVCTPHLYDWDPSMPGEARGVLEEVQRALDEEGIGLRLLLGFEVDATVVAEADAEMLAQLVIDGSVTSTHKGTILIETPYWGWPPFMEEAVFRLSAGGYTPVLAHPERNERIQRSPELLGRCLRAGAVAQGTAGSLAGDFRRSSMRMFFDLLARGDLSLLASDGHAQIPYTWCLGSLLEELRKRFAPDHIDTLVEVNPGRVISGRKPLTVADPRPRGKSWWKR